MAYPNTLISVDFPSSDPEASAGFCAAVSGREVEPRPAGIGTAFEDQWGDAPARRVKGGDDPQIPEGFTRD